MAPQQSVPLGRLTFSRCHDGPTALKAGLDYRLSVGSAWRTTTNTRLD